MSLIRARYRAVNTIMNLPRGGYVGLLDLFPNAAAAYSLRKLRAAYGGAAVRVRESGGNTEADIGFTSAGELDTTALLAHCGANDGFVTVWYDQSLSNDATQTTAANQPKIVNAGSLVTENGKAAVGFDGTDDVLTLPASIGTPFTGQGKAISSFSVSSIVSGNKTLWSITGTGNDDYYFASHDGSRFKFFARGNGGTLKSSTSSNTFGAGQYLKSDILPEEAASVQNGDMYIDGTQEVTSFDYATTSKTLDRGGGIGALVRSSISAYFNGNHQELIFYPSDQSTNRTGIEGSINEYYNIY